jgi:predicted RNase H-like HicB family nuclease
VERWRPTLLLDELDSIEEARKNLLEALELFFEVADPSEITARMHDEIFITRLEVAVG